jgi:hypothetical protein
MTRLRAGYLVRQGLSIRLLRRRGAITRWRQVAGPRVTSRSAATVGNIVGFNEAVARMPVRKAVALALAFWVVVIGAEWALPGTDVTEPHAHTGPVVAVNHPHIGDGSTPSAPDTFAEAVLPRTFTALAALGLIAGLATAVLHRGQSILAAIRGPPRAQFVNLSGRAVLTRLCIARR